MPLRPVLLSLSLLLAVAGLRAEDWPGWRGPTGQGHSAEKDLPLTWDGKTGENVLWKKPLLPAGKIRADHNQSSPIVHGGRVWATVSYWPEGSDPRAKPPEHHVLCFAAADGKLLWDATVPPGPWLLDDLRGGYTAPTPATDGTRLYVAFGSAVLAALDADGKLVWRKEIVPHDFDVAMAASPVVVGDLVILVCDFKKADRSRMLAFDRATGELKWEKPRGLGFCHSTPTLATLGGKRQLLVAGAGLLRGVDPTTGEMLWQCEAPGDTPSPVLAGGLVYIDSGRGNDAGVAVDPSGKEARVKWKIPKMPEGFSSPVAVGEHLYRLHNPGTLRCLTMATGATVYEKRLMGVETASSPIATADGRIYCASAGKSFVVQAGPEFRILGGGELDDPSRSSPAVAAGRLFLKGGKYLWCIGR